MPSLFRMYPGGSADRGLRRMTVYLSFGSAFVSHRVNHVRSESPYTSKNSQP